MVANPRTRTTSPIAAPEGLARWLIVSCVAISLIEPIAWLTLGLLRPGYSPIHQAISDLGVGPNGQIADTLGFLEGLLRIGFAAALMIVLRRLPSGGPRVTGATLLGISGAARLVVSVFTDAPATVAIHSTATLIVVVTFVVGLLLLGMSLFKSHMYRPWAVYTILTSALTVVMFGSLFMAFRPGSPIALAHIGGLLERITQVEMEAWFVALGLRLAIIATNETADEGGTRSMINEFREDKTVVVTTFREDGTPIDTPMHIAVDGDRAFLRTYASAWKWRRIRRNPQVIVSHACTGDKPAIVGLVTGKPHKVGRGVRAKAVEARGEEAASAARALSTKYPFLQGVLIPFLHRHFYRAPTIHIRLVPD
jgi:PPOX class probable F420-dependent enzyme